MASEETQLACKQLVALFPGRVICPGDEGYDEEVQRNWSTTSWIPAAAYVVLRSAEEVSKAILVIKNTNSKFAIRSAGHNANLGFGSVASKNSGIVLDLRGLKSRSLSISDKTACLGAGNTWTETFAWLEEKGLSAIGAREGQVGVSGFLLGGGQGIFSSSHGLGADNVKGFEVVLADGKIINANEECNPDLYTALKGGGSNFGIVTTINIQTYPLIKVQYTIHMYDPSDYRNVLEAFHKVQISMEYDAKIGLFINTRRDFIAIGMFYADWTTEIPAAFEPITNLTSLIHVAVPTSHGTMHSLSGILEEWAYKERDMKHAYLTMTTKISKDLYKDAHQIWNTCISALPRSADLHWSIQPLTRTAVMAGEKQGGNIMGLKKIPQSCWIFSCDWRQDQDDKTVHECLEEVLQEVEKHACNSGQLLELRFPTFAGRHQDVLGSFGTESTAKLQRVAARYDPDRVFQELQSGGFLLHRP